MKDIILEVVLKKIHFFEKFLSQIMEKLL